MPFDIWSDLALTALCGTAMVTWIGRDLAARARQWRALESAKPDVIRRPLAPQAMPPAAELEGCPYGRPFSFVRVPALKPARSGSPHKP